MFMQLSNLIRNSLIYFTQSLPNHPYIPVGIWVPLSTVVVLIFKNRRAVEILKISKNLKSETKQKLGQTDRPYFFCAPEG